MVKCCTAPKELLRLFIFVLHFSALLCAHSISVICGNCIFLFLRRAVLFPKTQPRANALYLFLADEAVVGQCNKHQPYHAFYQKEKKTKQSEVFQEFHAA